MMEVIETLLTDRVFWFGIIKTLGPAIWHKVVEIVSANLSASKARRITKCRTWDLQ